MIEALIAGERDPRRLADLARGKMTAKRAALIEALTGRFDAHHAELARMLLDQIDALTGQIDTLTTRIETLIEAIPAAQGVDPDGATGPHAGTGPDAVVLPAVARLDEIPGIGPRAAQIILAEIGTDMSRFPTAGHLVSWAKLCPRTIQSGPVTRGGKTGKGNPYLKGALGEAAAAAAKTDTFLGERYRRLVKRRGKLKALVAVARSILVIVWQLLTHDCHRQARAKAGVLHEDIQLHDALGPGAVQLAILKLVEVSKLDDPALLVELGGDPADAPGKRLLAKPRGYDVHMPHAVERGQNHRVRPNRGGQIAKRRFERIGFHGEQDGVELQIDAASGCEIASGNELWRECKVAMRTEDLEPVGLQVRRAVGAHQECHIPAGLCQAAAKISAGRTGSHNQ